MLHCQNKSKQCISLKLANYFNQFLFDNEKPNKTCFYKKQKVFLSKKTTKIYLEK